MDPIKFLRCGYRLSVETILRDRKSHVNVQVYKAARGAGLDPRDIHVKAHLERAVCLDIMAKEDFGGRQRIIEEQAPEKRKCWFWDPVKVGDICTVFAKKTVYTGTYQPGWSSSDYWTGEWDGEMPSLVDKQHHVVYQVGSDRTWDKFWIRAKFTRKWSEVEEQINYNDRIVEVNKRLDR